MRMVQESKHIKSTDISLASCKTDVQIKSVAVVQFSMCSSNTAQKVTKAYTTTAADIIELIEEEKNVVLTHFLLSEALADRILTCAYLYILLGSFIVTLLSELSSPGLWTNISLSSS